MRARLCSQNPHKLEELRASLPGWRLELLDADDYPAEDGATYEENARGKARFGRGLAPPDEWVLGEDSGIEVDALGGAPGIHSARWADDGNARLLAELEGRDDRSARYACTIVALGPGGEELVARGTRARRASATTRSSCLRAGRGRSRSSATPGRRGTRTAHGQPRG